MWFRFRKYGMGYCDLPTMLSNVTTMLKFLCLDIDPRNTKGVSFIFYIILTFTSTCYYYVYLISMIWFVFVRCIETGDLLAAIIVFSLGASSEISMTKLWCMFSERKNLRKLISSFLECDALVLPDSRFANHMKITLRTVKKRAITVWIVIIMNGIIYVAIPLVFLCFSKRRFMEDSFEFLGFDNMATMKTSPYFEFAFVINAVGVYVTCYPSANISALFIILAGYIEAQMLALAQELTFVWTDALKNYNNAHIITHFKDTNSTSTHNSESQELSGIGTKAWSDKEATSRTLSDIKHISTRTSIQRAFGPNIISEEIITQKERREINVYIHKRLAEIIKSHSMNINLLAKVEGVFRIAIAFEFLFLSIGLTAELLGDLGKTYIQLPFALMSVSIDCLIGQRIKDASMAFERAVYDSKWENFDVTNRKIILLMLRNSQKVMKLSAGSVATLTLECLMVVLKTTYSAYTTLRSTMN
nr:odorant receptor 8 [Phthorimaea operculella]